MVSSQTLFLVFLFALAITYHWWAPGLLRRPLFTHILIPSLLLIGWVGLIIFQSFQVENVFTLLTYEYPRAHLTTSPSGELHSGQKISGRFTASNNNLGIIGFRFWTFYRLNDDYLVFRLRQENSLNWYYQNQYKADQFQPNQYFTFGFPIIPDSKSQNYVFEIESLQGRPGVAVGLSQLDPVFIAKYKYSQQQVSSSWQEFIRFGLVKLENLIAKAEFRVSTFIYLLPFFLYLISFSGEYTLLSQRLKLLTWVGFHHLTKLIFLHRRSISISLLLLGTALDVTYIVHGDITVVILSLLWLLVIIRYQLSPKFIFSLSMTNLIIAILFYNSSQYARSERLGAWAWIFMVLVLIFQYQSLQTRSSLSRDLRHQ